MEVWFDAIVRYLQFAHRNGRRRQAHVLLPFSRSGISPGFSDSVKRRKPGQLCHPRCESMLRDSLRMILIIVTALLAGVTCIAKPEGELKAGAAAVRITPYGENPDWKGPITPTGVWGDAFVDKNKNGRWDEGEAFTADAANGRIDAKSANRYAGIYLAGFGNNRIATGMHDDLWARALVLEFKGKRIAIVSVDLIGYPQDSGYFGLDHVKKLVDAKLGIQEILLTSTHNHEGPDTIGIWGANATSDGKYPLYLEFVDRRIAEAVRLAAERVVPVGMKLGLTDPSKSPSLHDMQVRTEGRPPNFFDEELRVMQLAGVSGEANGKVVATLVNWNTHPESMEDENTILTSDFPGAVRTELEKRYGGTAIYVSGDLGAVEIVGDNNRSLRESFDGESFPMNRNDKKASFRFARTEAIGRDVAKAAIEAVERGEWSSVSGMELQEAEIRVPMDNAGYSFLMDAGVLRTPAKWQSEQGVEVVTEVSLLRLGDAQFLTTPGELFPEVFYGVAAHRRTDCPAADTGRPAEPAVRPLMTAKYKFVLGLSPEELGYIVPGYDFAAPAFSPTKGVKEAVDACATKGVPAHYHETNSASSQLAAVYACAAVQLLTGKPAEQPPCKDLSVKIKTATK